MSWFSWLMNVFDHSSTQFTVPRGVTIFTRKHQCVVSANVLDVTARIDYACPVVLSVSEDDPARVGRIILELLGKSRSGLTCEEFDRAKTDFYGSTGISGRSELERDWRLTSLVQQEDGSLLIAPMTRHSTGGYIGTSDAVDVTCPPESEAIGRALLEVLSRPEPDDIPEEPSHT